MIDHKKNIQRKDLGSLGVHADMIIFVYSDLWDSYVWMLKCNSVVCDKGTKTLGATSILYVAENLAFHRVNKNMKKKKQTKSNFFHG